MFNYEEHELMQVLKTKEVPSLFTYYHLINLKNRKKNKSKEKAIKQDSQTKIRSITEAHQFKQETVKSSEF